MKLILSLVLLIFLNIDLSKQIPTQLSDQPHENMDCVMKTIKRIQQLIIQSSGQNQTITESILETDNLEQKLHLLIATGATTLINATTLEHVPHPSEKDMELVYIDEEYQKEGGLRSICNELKKSFQKGRHHIYKVIDKYIRKDDLGLKMLEVAKILGKRIEKRMKYISMKLDEMMAYESS
ncbi:unnamed protein product [Schistosoma guineensis]|nr:unnamed protein product [Schistosoma guineensis]